VESIGKAYLMESMSESISIYGACEESGWKATVVNDVPPTMESVGCARMT